MAAPATTTSPHPVARLARSSTVPTTTAPAAMSRVVGLPERATSASFCDTR